MTIPGLIVSPIDWHFETATVTPFVRASVMPHVKHTEVARHDLPASAVWTVSPVSWRSLDSTQFKSISDLSAIYEIVDLAYVHYTRDLATPLVVSVDWLSRKRARIVAYYIELYLTLYREHVPYTIAWWYRTPSDGSRSKALFCLDHIGIEAMANVK